MFSKSKFIVVVIIFTLTRDLNAIDPDPNWWTHAVFYQIYPRSFKDSNNDGIGDINGIISKLDHLQDIGVTAVWLSPIYKSPQADQGYDISDFEVIDTAYGTMENFESLVTKAHEKGIKVIMDFVPNHSSDEHVWFTNSASNVDGFENYYVWRDGNGANPPNNWISIFKGSAWTLHPTRNQYYLHQFHSKQPDLNYNEPKVVTAMKNVLTFWLRKGVDGFRMDAVPMLFEDNKFLDEPRSNIPDVASNLPTYLKHVYTQDQPETFDMIYAWRKLLDDYNTEHGGDPRIMMTEVYTDIINTMYYYGNEAKNGAHFTFNFFLITDLNQNSNARDIASTVEKWIKNMPKKYVANWVLGNHDNSRVATRFGPENVDGYNMLIALLPGIMVTYNGEEIGQENGVVTFEEGKDPNACSAGRENFAKLTRDVERTPFHWDETVNAGFNTGFKPWLPVSSKYLVTNLAAQKKTDTPSHYKIYKELVTLRKEDTFKNGNINIRAVTDDVLVFSRSLQTGNSYLVIFNSGAKDATISIDRDLFSATRYLKVVIPSLTSTRKKGDLVSTVNLQIKAHESLVVVSTSDIPNTTVRPTQRPTTRPPDGATTQVQGGTTATSSGVSSLTTHCTVFVITLFSILIVAWF